MILVTRMAALPGGSLPALGPPRAAMASGDIQPLTNWMLETKPGWVNPPALMPAVKSKAVGPRAYRPSTPPDRDWSATFTPSTYLDNWRPAGAAKSTAKAIRYQVSAASEPLNWPSVPRPFRSGWEALLPT